MIFTVISLVCYSAFDTQSELLFRMVFAAKKQYLEEENFDIDVHIERLNG
jgi:hypothetical protein